MIQSAGLDSVENMVINRTREMPADIKQCKDGLLICVKVNMVYHKYIHHVKTLTAALLSK